MEKDNRKNREYNKQRGRVKGKKQDVPDRKQTDDQDQSEDYIYGKNPVLEYLKGNNPINRIMIGEGVNPSTYAQIMEEAKKSNVEVRTVKNVQLDDLAPKSVHQGVIAYISPITYCEPEDLLRLAEERNEKPLIVILDGLTDSRNIGAIIRTAVASGVHGIIMPKRRSAAVNAAAVKASAGTADRLLIARVANIPTVIDELKAKGVWVTGAVLNGAKHVWDCDFKDATALVVGSEDKGIGRLVAEKCDFLADIPMNAAVDSLNVSVATGIFLFEAFKQRAGL